MLLMLRISDVPKDKNTHTKIQTNPKAVQVNGQAFCFGYEMTINVSMILTDILRAFLFWLKIQNIVCSDDDTY